MSNQTIQEQIRSHSLARFLNDEKLVNIDATGRKLVSGYLEIADLQMRARCNNSVAELNRIDQEIEELAKEQTSFGGEYADWFEAEQARLMRRKMGVHVSRARAREQGVYKDYSGLREAVDGGKAVPDDAELPSFLTKAIDFVEIYGSPENNGNRTNLRHWLNPALVYLLLRDWLTSPHG